MSSIDNEGALSRCLMCGGLNYELDPLGYCEDCEPDVVENLDKQLMKPLYVYRMAKAVEHHATGGMLKSAKTRKRNAEKEIIKIVASA